jgi:hypothetical protein
LNSTTTAAKAAATTTRTRTGTRTKTTFFTPPPPPHRTTRNTPLSPCPPFYPPVHPPVHPPIYPSLHPALHQPHGFHYDSMHPITSFPGSNMDPNGISQRVEGYLDPQTRATNLQHTRPEWTTWDFVDLYLANLPRGIKTVDIWKNFRKEGEVALIDIFVTKSGQKDTKGKLRFRQVLSNRSWA